jgi:ATP-dependent DNA ligase
LRPGWVVDGELVVEDSAGERLDFPSLQRRAISTRHGATLAATHPATYVAFDVLAADGHDM